MSAVLAACGGDGKGGGTSAAAAVSQADIDKATSTATELTFWAWVPDIAQEVALFEQKYPAVKVKVVNAGQGAPEYTKLRTVLQAGTGAPDVAQIEFQYIPTFTITDSLLDLRPYGAAAVEVGPPVAARTSRRVCGPIDRRCPSRAERQGRSGTLQGRQRRSQSTAGQPG